MGERRLYLAGAWAGTKGFRHRDCGMGRRSQEKGLQKHRLGGVQVTHQRKEEAIGQCDWGVKLPEGDMTRILLGRARILDFGRLFALNQGCWHCRVDSAGSKPQGEALRLFWGDPEKASLLTPTTRLTWSSDTASVQGLGMFGRDLS